MEKSSVLLELCVLCLLEYCAVRLAKLINCIVINRELSILNVECYV